jgi:hypothetical protein
MRSERAKTILRCAVYTRVSTEHGLEQEFNSLDNQREASETYVKSQAHEGWKLIRIHYDDGGYSGGSMDRPALERLLDDVRAHRIDVIVVYKVDRLTRSVADFAKLVELFGAHQMSFVQWRGLTNGRRSGYAPSTRPKKTIADATAIKTHTVSKPLPNARGKLNPVASIVRQTTPLKITGQFIGTSQLG